MKGTVIAFSVHVNAGCFTFLFLKWLHHIMSGYTTLSTLIPSFTVIKITVEKFCGLSVTLLSVNQSNLIAHHSNFHTEIIQKKKTKIIVSPSRLFCSVWKYFFSKKSYNSLRVKQGIKKINRKLQNID